MSAAILYHVQGIRKDFLRKISIKKGIFIFECFWRHPEELKCAGCGSGNVRRKGTKMRIFTGVPMGNMRTRIHAEIPRVHCLDCGKVAQIHIFSTTIPTQYRVNCLMTDHVYRMAIVWQNAGYNQPPHLGRYLPKMTQNGRSVNETPKK
ncbi:MAG: transposase family protein [Planctomycetia bacterium]|nr:transposase family protein [Planctomycetia bacterium]